MLVVFLVGFEWCSLEKYMRMGPIDDLFNVSVLVLGADSENWVELV